MKQLFKFIQCQLQRLNHVINWYSEHFKTTYKQLETLFCVCKCIFSGQNEIVKYIYINLQKLISNMIKFRETNSENYTNEIIRLYNDCFSKGLSQQYIDQTELQHYIAFILKNGTALIASEDEKIAGTLLCYPMSFEPDIPEIIKSRFNINNAVYIAELMVNEEYRGQGIGKNLMNEFLKAPDKNIFKEAFIRVWELNLPALQLYKNMGFSTVASITQEKKRIDGNGTFEMRKLYLHKKLI